MTPEIDLAYLREMTDNDDEGMRRLVAIYLSDTASELSKLQAALATGNAEEAHRLAHGCKGASATYGVHTLEAILKEIERLAHDRRLSDIPPVLARALDAFKRVEEEWRTYLERFPTKDAA